MQDWMDDGWQKMADLLYEAAWDARRWNDALRQLTDLFHCAEGCYVRHDPGAAEGLSVLASTWHDEGYLRLYREIQALNPYMGLLLGAPVGHVVSDGFNDLRADPGAKAFCDIWYVPRGLHSAMVLKMPGPLGSPGYISLDRGVHQRPFDRHDLELARRIVPDLVRATRLHLRVTENRWAEQTRLAGGATGCLLLDGAERRVLRANERALALLAGVDAPLTLLAAPGDASLGRLYAPVSKTQDALAKLIDCTLRSGGGGECVLRTNGASPGWHVQATPIVQPMEWGLGLHRAVCLMLRPLQAISLPNAQRLQLLFGLSPKEAAVAASLAAGIPLKQVAEQLGMGLSTARTHLAHVFDKTGLRSQTALIALMAGGLGSGLPMAAEPAGVKEDDVGCDPYPLFPS